MDEKMRAATDVAGLVGYQAELKEKINAVSRRSLDGSVVMSGEEWNGIVELVEKLLTADPAPPAVQGEPDVARHDAMRFALSEMVKWYENISLGNNPAFQYYNLAKKALLSAAPQPAEQPECGCCGQTVKCDDDCDAVVLRKAEQKPDVAQLVEALELAIEYWRHRQQRYRNRKPRWVADALSALAAHRKGEAT